MALLLSRLAYDPAVYSATLLLSQSYRNVRNGSLTAGYDGLLLGGFFHPKVNPWAIPADRMGVGLRYRRGTETELGWLFQTPPAVFDPSSQPWVTATDRLAPGRRYPRDTNTDVSWLANNVPITGWNAPTDRLARASAVWRQETNPDNAWLSSAQPVVVVFDPALFPGIAALVGYWTPSSASLQTAYYLALVDLSWVHDVIPLTDPEAGAFIRLRPIAPIVHSRRRKRRR